MYWRLHDFIEAIENSSLWPPFWTERQISDIFLNFQKKIRYKPTIPMKYNQIPHLTQDTNGKSDNLTIRHHKQSQEVSIFPACDHKASTNRRAWKHNKTRPETT